MTEDTKTTLSTIVDPKDVQSAIDLWESSTKDTLKALKVMSKIGAAINLIYDTGESKSIKRDVVTSVVKDTFVGLDRRERSDFRAIAKNLSEIEAHAEAKNTKSLNPTYLLNQWRTSVKKAAQAEAAKVTVLRKAVALGDGDGDGDGDDGDGDPDNDADSNFDELFSEVVPEKVSVSEPAVKKGYDNIVRPDPLSGKEVVANVGAAVNHAITYFNQGKLKADDLATLEKHLTNTLQHINQIEQEDMLLTASL